MYFAHALAMNPYEITEDSLDYPPRAEWCDYKADCSGYEDIAGAIPYGGCDPMHSPNLLPFACCAGAEQPFHIKILYFNLNSSCSRE
jgi:hypothetical protein